jgi:hypothetical protein
MPTPTARQTRVSRIIPGSTPRSRTEQRAFTQRAWTSCVVRKYCSCLTSYAPTAPDGPLRAMSGVWLARTPDSPRYLSGRIVRRVPMCRRQAVRPPLAWLRRWHSGPAVRRATREAFVSPTHEGRCLLLYGYIQSPEHVPGSGSRHPQPGFTYDLARWHLRELCSNVMSEAWTPEDSEFWSPIVCPDGTWDIEQVKRELHDYHLLLAEVPKVYRELTQSRISKPNTLAHAVILTHAELCTNGAPDDERPECSLDHPYACVECGATL